MSSSLLSPYRGSRSPGPALSLASVTRARAASLVFPQIPSHLCPLAAGERGISQRCWSNSHQRGRHRGGSPHRPVPPHHQELPQALQDEVLQFTMGVCSTRWRRISWHKLGTQLELHWG